MRTHKGMAKLWGMCDPHICVGYLDPGEGSVGSTYVKSYHILCFKYVWCISCQS